MSESNHTGIEIWKQVAGYEGLYEVSNQGRVKTLSRRLVFRNGKQRGRVVSTKILKQSPDKDGYPLVCLYSRYDHKNFRTHFLVLTAFVGPKPIGMEACHFPDKDKWNNHLRNLQWGTTETNASHRVIHGSCAGENNSRAKIKESDIADMKRLRKEGVKMAAIGRIYGVHGSTVRRATEGESWKNSQGVLV